jgi:O-antigen/teichoic acid export membrane protein
MIVALAKQGNSFMVGQFSLGLAIATPVLMFTNLHLRAVQATDATRSYRFHEYLRLRVLTTVAALAAIAALVLVAGYQRETAIVVLAVALVKAIDTLSDIHYGLFQQHDRLDQTGTSLIVRGVLSVVALSAALYLTGSVLWACIVVAAVWLIALLFYDSRRARFLERGSGGTPSSFTEPSEDGRGTLSARATGGAHRQWKLIRLAFPLGVVMTLASINLNIPRYFIHAQMGEHQLGLFSAMAYATVAVTLVSDSLGHAGIPKLSRLYAECRLSEFRALLVRLLGLCCLLGMAAVAVAQVGGSRLLTLIYSREYAAHSRVFTLLILATAINCVASVLTSGITSARRFGIQVPLYALSAAAGVLACALWFPGQGLYTGAAAMVCSAAVRLLLAGIVVGYLLSRAKSLAALATPVYSTGEDWRQGL